jgi:phosphatidylinositol alpha-mannosyltransferase
MSHYSLDILRREYGRTGALTPGGVNFDEFKPAAAREPHPAILFSGAVAEPRKGLATLLEALPLVAEKEPDVALWISGQGDVSSFLDAASAEARRRTEVLDVGGARSQAERYGRAWATALPSEHDSFGMALVESLACGTPIVASKHGAPWELVSPGTGAACEPRDVASVAGACVEALALARRPETVERCRASAGPYEWRSGIAPSFEAFYTSRERL